MKTQSNIQAVPYPGLLEIVFNSRNKEYGAYALRKSYKRNLNAAMIITIILFGISLSLPIILKKTNPVVTIPGTTTTTFTNVNVDTKDKEIESIAKINKDLLLKPSIKFLPPKVTIDSEVPDDAMIPTIDDLKDKLISTITREGNVDGIEFIPEEIPLDENEKIVEPVKEHYFSWVEEMPGYPGGDDAFMNFIWSNIRYPEIAKKAGIEGRVVIQFVVEKDGNLSDIQIVKSIGGGCDEEALRVLKLCGKWNPGKQNGKAVRVKMVVPFSFRLT